MVCPKCNFQNPEGEVVCQKCQAVIAVPPPPTAGAEPTVVARPMSIPEIPTANPLKKWLWVWAGGVGLIIILVTVVVMAIRSRSSSGGGAGPATSIGLPATVAPTVSVVINNDTDSDGVPNDVEAAIGTNPNYQECSEFLTNPCGLITASVEGFGAAKNVLIILDSSGSMAEKISGKSKMDIAKGVLSDYLKTLIDKGFRVGLMVYGHQGSNSAKDKPVSCAGIETVLPVGSSQNQISAALASFSPTGWTPIGGSLTQAKDVLVGFTGQDNYVLLVSDGEETCGGNPAAAARSLRESDVKAIVDVIGFNVDTKTRSQLESVAAVGGGKFIFSADEAGFRQATAQVQAGLLTAKSGLNAQICVAQEKHKLLSCLSDFYYIKARPKITGLREKSVLTEKYEQMEKKFDDLTAQFVQKSREAIQEGVKQIDEGRTGR